MKNFLSIIALLFCVGIMSANTIELPIESKDYETSITAGDSSIIVAYAIDVQVDTAIEEIGIHNESEGFYNEVYSEAGHINYAQSRYGKNFDTNRAINKQTNIKTIKQCDSFSQTNWEHYRSRMYSGRTEGTNRITTRSYKPLSGNKHLTDRTNYSCSEENARLGETISLCWYSSSSGFNSYDNYEAKETNIV